MPGLRRALMRAAVHGAGQPIGCYLLELPAGRTPAPGYRDGFARNMGARHTETPALGPARLRAAERRVTVQGLRFYNVAARSDETGELAALTQLGVDPANPGWGFQEQTSDTGRSAG